jgi:hypothetical protein
LGRPVRARQMIYPNARPYGSRDEAFEFPDKCAAADSSVADNGYVAHPMFNKPHASIQIGIRGIGR